MSVPPPVLPKGGRVNPGIEGSLGVRLAWLTGLRLLVLTLLLLVITAVYLRDVEVGAFSTRVALVSVAAAYGVAVIYAVFLRMGRYLSAVAHAQLVTDQLTWTALVYITGGVSSGATSLYGLTCLSGAILVGASGAVTAALGSSVCLVALTAAMLQGILPIPPDQAAEAYASTWKAATFPLVVNVLGVVVVAGLSSYLGERLRWTGGRLEQERERAEKAESLALLGQLAAGLAHEIRNPLGAIKGSIELLRDGPGLQDEDRHLCTIIEREAMRLDDLVSDMLDLARQRAPQPERTDLCNTARDVVLLARRHGRGGEVEVRFDGPERADVLVDASQLRQVVWNLVRNAMQASSAGDAVSVEVRQSGKDDVILSIHDRGVGISEDARARLFDAFYTTRSHGTGLGLAVVKRVLDEHGLVIEVDSGEGKGTTFSVRFPAMEPLSSSDRAVPSSV